MFIGELMLALLFYVAFSLFALIGLPFLSRLTPHKTLSYFASKPLGLILFGYVIWLGASIHIIDYQNYFLILALLIISLAVGLFYCKNFFAVKKIDEVAQIVKSKKKERVKTAPWTHIKRILLIEGISLFVLFIYLWIRSTNSEINGTERFMDMALLTASGKTHFFPFLDPWYAGKTVNYYYYGSYLISLLSNITRIPYALSYNFALGLIYLEACILSASLIYTISRSKFFALAGAFFVTTAGTLYYANCSIMGYFSAAHAACSYASSTRLYTPSYMINEIPSYSFTVGDLHAHLLALLFFVLDIILIYILSKSQKPKALLFILIGISMATSGMINAWDAVTLASVLVVFVLLKAIIGYVKDRSIKDNASWLIYGAGTIILLFALMWPNLRNFQSPVIGLGFIPTYLVKHSMIVATSTAAVGSKVSIFTLLGMYLISKPFTNVQYPTPLIALLGMWGVFVIGAAYVFYFKRKDVREHTSNYLFLITTSIVSIGILIGVELFFIKDIYSIANPDYFRANTTFKFGYHAWTMLSIISSSLFGLLFLHNKNKLIRTGIIVIVAVGLIGGFIYPYEAVKQFYLTAPTKPELDGSVWIKDFSAGDKDTIDYINKNFKERAIIAEAVGDSYTQFARISTYTGMITPMGWKTHEWTWRFQGKDAEKAPIGTTVETGWGAVSTVGNDIDNLYLTSNLDEAKALISKYNIQYIYVGNLERTTYTTMDEKKFSQLGTPIYQSNGSILFAVNKS